MESKETLVDHLESEETQGRLGTLLAIPGERRLRATKETYQKWSPETLQAIPKEYISLYEIRCRLAVASLENGYT